MRSTYALVNLTYLQENYLNIRREIKNVKVMPVVKADAYGHGVKKIVSALNSLPEKPEYYAVALVDEGTELRNYEITQPILIFEPPNKDSVDSIFNYDLIPTVFCEDHLSILKTVSTKKKIKIHIKVNTGMNRLGINHSEAYEFIKRTAENNLFIIDGIYTHFAASDKKDKSFTKVQLKRFKGLLNKLKNNKISYGLAHAANTGAILDLPESYLDMVRPGISLYGYYPSGETTESIQLKPVMSVISKVDSVNRIKKGETVSYGRRFTAGKSTTIISASMGYADGYRRDLTNKAKAIINGRFYNQVGTVTMDRIMFNINNDKINVGDEVILLGEKDGLRFNANDWAKILKTIPYEITCGISKRVPRIYVN